MHSAEDIATELLSITGEALLAGDFGRFSECFLLPQTLTTPLGQSVARTVDDLHVIFARVRWHFRSIDVTDLERRCLSAIYTDPQTIMSLHASRLLRHGVEIQDPFKVLSRLVLTGGRWMIAESDYAISDSVGHTRALLGPGTGDPTDKND